MRIEQILERIADRDMAMNESELIDRIEAYSRFPVRGKLRIFTDTTQFMEIASGDVLELDGIYYLVRGEEVEGRFGLDGEPKFWVKRAIDLSDGSSKIIKLVFHETFMMQLGEQQIRCFRSPLKEARILKKVKDDPHFMHGFDVQDQAGNSVRIIDRIKGKRFYDVLNNLEIEHETYFYRHFPVIFRDLVSCIEAIHRLHEMGELHGDIRNDHILIDSQSGVYTWIDFDYTYEWFENRFGVDLYGLGNVLLFAIGKGFHNLPDLMTCAPPGMQVASCLQAEDLSLFFSHRIINLRKLFPYIPECLNHILMHFSQGAEVFYETTEELLDDLQACINEVPSLLTTQADSETDR